ncbi:MAG: serine hydrolase [Bacteroidota bacterium]
MRHHLLFLFLVYYSGTMVAQLPSYDLEAYEAAQKGLVLLKDEPGLLPLGNLDTLRPFFMSVGMEDDSELYQTLNTYIPTARVDWQNQEEPFKTTWPYPHQDSTANLLILAIDGQGLMTAGFPWDRFLFSKEVPVIVIWFGRSPATMVLDAPSFQTIVFAEDDTPWSQSLTAQLLFGAIPAQQRLKSWISEAFPIGAGQMTSTAERLAFTPAQALGFDSQLLQDSIAAIMQDGLTHQAFPGAQVLVAKGGNIVYHETFGYHTELAERPVQTSDIYDLASVTKITSALPALIKWYGEGTFDLDAPLVNYYPDAKGSNKEDLTFRPMLSHHARLRPWIPYWQATLRGNGKYPWSRARDPKRLNDYRFRGKTLARDSSAQYPLYLTPTLWQHRDYQRQMMKAILKSPLNEETKYRYSGLLFYLLPEIVSRQSGTSYETYLNSTFYRPLGAYTLGFNPSRFFPLERIIPTERDSFFRWQLLHGYVHDEGAAMMGGLSANAGLFSNAYDLAKIMQLYLNGGTYGGERYFIQAAIDTFTRRHYAEEDNRRGLGFDKPLLEYDPERSSVAKAASPTSFGHSGYTGTFVWADPEHDLLFIFLSNRVYPSRNNRGIYTRNIRPRIHTAIYEAMGSGE